MFQDSGRDPCPFYQDVFIEWKVAAEKKDGCIVFEVDCPCLTEGRSKTLPQVVRTRQIFF